MDQDTLLSAYRSMYRSRVFEEHVIKIWEEGLITGEMHTSIGEEGIMAGIISHLKEGDALALDHRGTSPAIIRGISPLKLLLEFMGHDEGLCHGQGGHMHIFSKDHLVASSGIVGSSGPAATGFALSAKYKRPGKIAVAVFGEGAANQGMMMESFNMASALKLPVLFVCKNNGWAITTVSSTVTAGNLAERAKAFDMPAYEVDGSLVSEVLKIANKAIDSIRKGEGPAFLLADCINPYGHFLNDPLLSAVSGSLQETMKTGSGLIKSLTAFKGASLGKRLNSLKVVTSLISKKTREKSLKDKDPLENLRNKLTKAKEQIRSIESEVSLEMSDLIKQALTTYRNN